MTEPLRVLVTLLLGLLLAGCGAPVSDETAIEEPAVVEHEEGSAVARVSLTGDAIERLQIETAAVGRKGRRTIVPSAALIVDPEGVFWVHTNPRPGVFIRHEVRVDHQDDGAAFLLEGPPVGTLVVTVGVAELYGAEFEIGH